MSAVEHVPDCWERAITGIIVFPLLFLFFWFALSMDAKTEREEAAKQAHYHELINAEAARREDRP